MEAPQRFGKYRVERTLGSGAFATVWLAHDDDLDDDVAIKVLADNWSGNPDVRKRFIDEAKFLRQLDYDGVVRVHTVDELGDGRPYFVMTYADRGTLQDRHRARLAANTAFSLREALGYAIDIVDCLEVVHDYGIMHRDIKPSNVLFRSLRRHQRGSGLRDDRLMLGDFGLAKDLDRSGFTLAAGTPAYMAPEQARASDDLDSRADLFSTVAVLYELVCGKVPFPGNRGLDAFAARGDDPALEPLLLSSVRDRVPPELDELVRRGLKIDREKRFQSARELGVALREVHALIPDDDMPIPQERSRLEVAPITETEPPPVETNVPTASGMLLAMLQSVDAQFGPMSATAAVRSRLTSPPKVIIAGATQTHVNEASRVLVEQNIEVSVMVDALHPESSLFLSLADAVVVVPAPGVLDAVQSSLRTSFAGPVVVVALVADSEEPLPSSADLAAVADVQTPLAVTTLLHSAVVVHADLVRTSGALSELEHRLKNDPSPVHAEVWQTIADRVDGMRLAHPELVEFDVLRLDARGALKIPEPMRLELRRLVLGTSSVSRLGLGADAPIAAARAATDEALQRWRTYLGSGRAPFAARGVVGTIARSLERLWVQLSDD